MTGPKPMQYKMVFSDIDGTLLDSNNQISGNTISKIQELYLIGIPFILVSARMPSGVLLPQSKLGTKAPIICYSGALILDEGGHCIKSIGIDCEKAILIDAYMKKDWKDICFCAYYNNDWIVSDIYDEWVVQEQKITSSVPTKAEISDSISTNGQVHKFLCMGETARIESLSKALREKNTGLSISRSKDTYLEITNSDATKSAAVRYLCDYYGVPIEATVSFGDNYNDVDMLLATGTSFAMGNAPEKVKMQARNVTLDNDREGVLAGLKQLNFGNRA